MKLTKLSYFISAVLLMILHSHTYSLGMNDNLVITQSSVTQTFLQSALPKNTPLTDIEAFEVEDKDDSKVLGRVISLENYVDYRLLIEHLNPHPNKFSFPSPFLSYKSLPSYLQVFII